MIEAGAESVDQFKEHWALKRWEGSLCKDWLSWTWSV